MILHLTVSNRMVQIFDISDARELCVPQPAEALDASASQEIEQDSVGSSTQLNGTPANVEETPHSSIKGAQQEQTDSHRSDARCRTQMLDREGAAGGHKC